MVLMDHIYPTMHLSVIWWLRTGSTAEGYTNSIPGVLRFNCDFMAGYVDGKCTTYESSNNTLGDTNNGILVV